MSARFFPVLRRFALVLLALAALVGAGRGADAEDDEATRKSKHSALEHEVLRATAERKWAEVERLTREQIRLLPNEKYAHYNLACALALQDKKADALVELKRAVDLGFDDVGH